MVFEVLGQGDPSSIGQIVGRVAEYTLGHKLTHALCDSCLTNKTPPHPLFQKWF